jgi:hypothetical protein
MFNNFENKIINCLLYEPINRYNFPMETSSTLLTQIPKIICIEREVKRIINNENNICCCICLEKKCNLDNYLNCNMLICNTCIYKVSICPICNTKNCMELQYESEAERIKNIKEV